MNAELHQDAGIKDSLVSVELALSILQELLLTNGSDTFADGLTEPSFSVQL